MATQQEHASWLVDGCDDVPSLTGPFAGRADAPAALPLPPPIADSPRLTPIPRSSGSLFATNVKSSVTFVGVFADVSINMRPSESAYFWPSSAETVRLVSARSNLLPTRAIVIFASACRCSSRIQLLAFSKLSCSVISYTTSAQCAFR